MALSPWYAYWRSGSCATPAILAMAGLGFAGLLWIWDRLTRAPEL